MQVEQAQREGSTRQREVENVIESLRSFFKTSEWNQLTALRRRNWRCEDDQLVDLEAQLAGLQRQKNATAETRQLRAKLRDCSENRQEREELIATLARRVPGLVYREPRSHDFSVEDKVVELLSEVFDEWQVAGWIPNWRIEPGDKTDEPIRTKGWTYWHHLFTPRQLLMNGYYSRQIAHHEPQVRAALALNLGRLADTNARLCRWLGTQGGGIGGTKTVFYNQALNPFPNYAGRGWTGLTNQLCSIHAALPARGERITALADAREVKTRCNVWITDPPYADAVNYEELSEYFLAWYVPHLKAVFPQWYTDSMRARAVKGDDAPFRVAMADCYKRLMQNMPDDGLQVLMFTHKSTDVWEDLALIMWAAGLQVKQVWSVATETAGLGVRSGNYVQATYNMVLRKRTSTKMTIC
jgi:adenine-specific DNA methylase